MYSLVEIQSCGGVATWQGNQSILNNASENKQGMRGS